MGMYVQTLTYYTTLGDKKSHVMQQVGIRFCTGAQSCVTASRKHVAHILFENTQSNIRACVWWEHLAKHRLGHRWGQTWKQRLFCSSSYISLLIVILWLTESDNSRKNQNNSLSRAHIHGCRSLLLVESSWKADLNKNNDVDATVGHEFKQGRTRRDYSITSAIGQCIRLWIVEIGNQSQQWLQREHKIMPL